jgi:hypothetical protein
MHARKRFDWRLLMKLLIALCLLISSAHAFEITYSCDNYIEKEVLASFDTWNTACDGIFTVRRVQSGADIRVINIDGGQFFEDVPGPDSVYYNADMTMAIGRQLGLDSSALYPAQSEVDQLRAVFGLSPKVFDFTLKQKPRRVMCSNRQACCWSISDGFYRADAARFVHTLPKGVFTVTMIFHQIRISKFITVR